MKKYFIGLLVCALYAHSVASLCSADPSALSVPSYTIAITAVDQPTQLAILAIIQKLDRLGIPYPPPLKEMFHYFLRNETSVPTKSLTDCKEALNSLILEHGEALEVPSLDVLVTTIAAHQVAAKSLGVSL